MSRVTKTVSQRANLKSTGLRTEIVSAERWAETAQQMAIAAKAEFKRSRKAFRRAKKTAKEAWREVKALKEALRVAVEKAAPKKKKKGGKKISRESTIKRKKPSTAGRARAKQHTGADTPTLVLENSSLTSVANNAATAMSAQDPVKPAAGDQDLSAGFSRPSETA